MADDIVTRLRVVLDDLRGRGGELWDRDGNADKALADGIDEINRLRDKSMRDDKWLASLFDEIMRLQDALSDEASRG